MPAGCRPLYQTFVEMRKRTGGGMGPAPITHEQVRAWCELHHVRLTPWEIDCIFDLDDVALASVASKDKHGEHDRDD